MQNKTNLVSDTELHITDVNHQAVEIMGKRMTSNTIHEYISVLTIKVRGFFLTSLGVAILIM